MLIEIAVVIMAVAVVALVAFLIPVWIHLRHTAKEAERLLRHMNEELPPLLREASLAARNVNTVAVELRQAVGHAKVLGEAIGEVGDTINQVHGMVRGGAGTLLTNVGSLLAGFRAAVGVFTRKSSESDHQQGGSSNGG